ncbi:hypothetical protein E5S67_03181 [Microcoleus sp. IPMA8]|uniref:Uncharacterized protein n=1 Tax=Microcoleus asticus IPMA8 TaxID=2563858 RepID=A0ABX2CYR3_9CYAN|nr:hypothetical protein [Microcoleus asticus IPMA8]
MKKLTIMSIALLIFAATLELPKVGLQLSAIGQIETPQPIPTPQPVDTPPPNPTPPALPADLLLNSEQIRRTFQTVFHPTIYPRD